MCSFNWSVGCLTADNPNCLWFTFHTTVSSTHSTTIDSTTFAARPTGVRDIDRMSLSIEAGGLHFWQWNDNSHLDNLDVYRHEANS